MKVFLIVTNIKKDPNLEFTKEITEYLESKGAVVKNTIRKMDRHEDNKISDVGDADYIIVLGGDGTILQATRDMAGKNIPILGVNMGTLGFLSEIDPNQVKTSIDRILSGDYEIKKRMMLTASVKGQYGISELPPALNDVSIIRCGTLQIIRFNIFVNGEFLCNISADGIILATPTGSTGYNMSAGGPIVEPEAELILLTPICAHNFTSKSVVLNAADEIEIVVDESNADNLTLEANSDGNDRVDVTVGDRIIIKKSEYTSSFIKLSNTSFLQTLKKKMSE